ncbi:acyl carrier protein [Arthrobacter mangrovi]|uniref:Carrier domain-containing protein n=1 Tax=Arthrobacter mangrovi TaxID=2966350 RepID=A0ABQ5MW32_9MICC|nr:acyl carrier protein [Arthrobacter mangrovi]GLB68196.1 hypothetical protein AHIS1636_26380 [Arthrobacter mangrovi]
MNRTKAAETAWAALHQVAPDLEPDLTEGGARLRQDLELDSLDFLALVETLSRDAGVEIPESDYAQVATVDGLVGYLETHG